MFYRIIIIHFLLIIIPLSARTEDQLISVPEISEDMLKQANEVVAAVEEVKKNDNYKSNRNWIVENKQKLIARQAEPLPDIDNKKSKDAISTLLNKYRFKNEEINKSQITHYPLMIFVSSSIPKTSLKDLMIQAKLSGGVLVFKGIIDGSLSKTVRFLGEISKEHVQAIIDPRLFDVFKVEVVPTFVVLKDTTQECDDVSCQMTPIHDRISGNITLNYVLETFAAGDGQTKLIAANFLKKIEGGQNEKK